MQKYHIMKRNRMHDNGAWLNVNSFDNVLEAKKAFSDLTPKTSGYDYRLVEVEVLDV